VAQRSSNDAIAALVLKRCIQRALRLPYFSDNPLINV